MSASREKRLRRELREAELNSDIVTKKKPKKQKTYMAEAKKKKIYSAIKSAIAIVIVLVFALLIFVNCGFLQKNTTALTVGEHKISPVEFNYFYQDAFLTAYNTYNSYGMWNYMVDTTSPIEDQTCYMGEEGQTWKEYLTDTAGQNALQVYALYDAAMADGYTLSEETQAALDSSAASFESYAKSNGFKNADDYLEETYGKGATLESYLAYLNVQQIASGYSAQKGESFTYDEATLRSYYDDHKQDFDTVSYRVFTVAEDENDASAAKTTADAMKAELDGTEDSFAQAALSYAPEDSKESYEDTDATLRTGASYSSVSANDYGNWLFDTARISGESEVFATDSGYSVVMFVSRDDNNYQTVDVRHILAQVATSGEDGTSTDADWEDCLARITEVQEAWEATSMTEDDFAALATEKTEDTGSASTGGLYEDVHKGQMVSEFEDWCFDETRQPGDTGLVKSDYGYHFMYYVGTCDYYWKSLADSAKRNDDYNAWYEEFSAAYTAKTSGFGQLFTNKTLPTMQ